MHPHTHTHVPPPSPPAGDVESDFFLGLDLLKSSKDHNEFTCVLDWVRGQLQEVAEGGVQVEVPKSVIKQVRRCQGGEAQHDGMCVGGAAEWCAAPSIPCSQSHKCLDPTLLPPEPCWVVCST